MCIFLKDMIKDYWVENNENSHKKIYIKIWLFQQKPSQMNGMNFEI